jgi:hypothetical protein
MNTKKDFLQTNREGIIFFVHLFVFLAVNLFLIYYNLLKTPSSLWFYFPLLIWGIGLVTNGLNVFASDLVNTDNYDRSRISV